MSNWLEEEKERKKLYELQEQEQIIREERISAQIKRLKDHIAPFYSYIKKVKDEGFLIKVIEYSNGDLEINNYSDSSYRSIKIEPAINNYFFVSITGTYHISGHDYSSPIVEEITIEEHSYTRETRKQEHFSYDQKKKILEIKCNGDELIQFLNNEANALKIIGWLFDKTKLHTRWFPGIIPAELVYKKGIKDAKEEYNSELVKKILITVLVGGLIGLVLWFIINSIFKSGIGTTWTIIIWLAWACVVYEFSPLSIYQITKRPAKEDSEKFNFEF